MEIVSLRLVASDDDLNNLLAKFISAPAKLRDLRIGVIQDGLSVAGVYEAFLPIPCESFGIFLFVTEKSSRTCQVLRLSVSG